jgi:transcriptional regulator with XRE-family HTH domain|nr:MAG TPA_asm: Helix-turn-helix XRE-family like protein [Caudoviricetes sp.]
MKSLAITIKKYREEKGFTQIELAKKAGIGNGTLADIETGKNKSTSKTVNKIIAALGLNQDEKNEVYSAFLGKEISNTDDERVKKLNKRERLQYEDFINDSVLYFQDEGVSFEDKEKFFNSLQDAFFEIKLANKRKK